MLFTQHAGSAEPPSVARPEAVVSWNNDENKWKAGLLDEQLEPKEAYRALDQLINHEWKTRTSGQTNAAGEFAFRGFHGKYKITVRHGNTTQTFDVHVAAEGSKDHKIVMKDER